jgi:hypothetical protein
MSENRTKPKNRNCSVLVVEGGTYYRESNFVFVQKIEATQTGIAHCLQLLCTSSKELVKFNG